MRPLMIWAVVSALAGGFALPARGAITDPVSTDAGRISGTTGSDPSVRIYRGIPYAAPPLGDLRWRAPQPAAHWEGVRSADHFGNRCMQAGRTGAAPSDLSEDCLFLNVWTAASSADERRPVMVWAHPGGYTSGSGNYDGEPLAGKGVVLVTFNYRLGPFGFFSHPELTRESGRSASGNQALMDMAEVLQWVQRNIAAFGGDPARVTITGDSAGAAMNAGMVGSPHAKGLFRRAGSESGAWMGLSMSPMIPLVQAEENGKHLETALGASSLAEMRARPAAEIQDKGRGSGMIIDGWFVPEDLSLTFAAGRQNKVDVLIGSNKDEGTFFDRPTTAAQFSAQMRQRWGDLADAFLKLYPAGTDAEAHASSLVRFRDELGWNMRTYATAQQAAGARVYLYYFTHEPPSAPGQPSRGATHGAEAAYVFNTPSRLWTDADKALGEQISSYWVNFAATGDPNGKGLPQWHAYGDDARLPMVLGENVAIQPDGPRMALYDKLYARQKPR